MPTRPIPLFVAGAAALALAACNDAKAPSASNTAASPYGSALPDPGPLDPTYAAYDPQGAPVYDGYALAERAHAFDTRVQRQRPSYRVNYEDNEVLAWDTPDRYAMYAEPIDGGYRDYYYAPGADRPYFVRDDDYGYGYAPDGRLAAVYDSRGGLLSGDRLAQAAVAAASYYLRAQTVRRYAIDDRYRAPVSEPYWTERSSAYYAGRQAWIAAPERQPEWQAWRKAHAVRVASPQVVEHRVVEARHDNGKHLGWQKNGKAERLPPVIVQPARDDRFAVAYAQPGPPRADKHDGDEGPGKGPGKPDGDGGHDHGKHGGGDKGEGHGKGHGKGHKD